MRSLALATSLAAAGAAHLSETVDTRIGAGGIGYGAGSINPGAQVPFGAMRLGPDTTWMDPTWGNWWLGFQHFGGYAYIDNSITAFSHTHMVGPGINDLGDFGVMVTRQLTETTIEDSAENAKYASAFSHDNETAVAGYYATYLQDASTYAELTVSGTHSGIHRYTCEDAPSGRPNECILLLDLAHTAIAPPAVPFGSITVSRLPTSPGTVVLQATILQKGGLSERGPLGGIYVYFYAEASAISLNGSGLALPRLGVWENNTLLSPAVLNATSTSNNIGGFADFGAGPLAITVRTGISFIGEDAAKANLYAQQTSGAAQLQAGQGQRKLRSRSEPGFGKAPKHPYAAAAAEPAYTAPSWLSFDEVRAQAQAQWEGMLGRVAVTLPPDVAPGDAAGNLTSFYSAVYRSFLAPTTYSEADGRYLGMDGNVHSVLASPQPLASYHSDMSIWDIHRSQTPWLLLVAPETAVAVANSLLTMAAQGGKLPRWPLANVYTGCMDGSHAVIILGDMLSKGLPGLNTSAIYAATLAALTAQEDPSYLSLGFVSTEQSNTAASSTLEYAYDDAIAAVIARIAGEDAQADAWAARAQGYRKIWNSTVSLPCPRSASGEFACPAIPELPYPIDSGYVEGDALQYQTFVPHDQAYVDALTSLQAKQLLWPFGNILPNAWYWAGNEPDILAPWQFGVAGNAYANLTQYWTRWLLHTYFTTKADGIPGNDDFGTMSAWAAWAYLGLYPVTGTGMYALGSPTFANATVALPTAIACAGTEEWDAATLPTGGAIGAGSTVLLQVIAHNASVENVYVAAAAVNGVQLATPFVDHTALFPQSMLPAAHCALTGSAPALLEFWMSAEPVAFASL